MDPTSELNVSHRNRLLESVVSQRTTVLEYIKRVHDEHLHWMGTSRLTDAVFGLYLRTNKENIQRRTLKWFSLGTSLAKVLNLSLGNVYIRGVAQLLEEYEFCYGSAASKGLRMLRAFTSNAEDIDTEESLFSIPEAEPVKPTVGRTFMFLEQKQAPFPLDYKQVVLSLCDIVSLAYRKFLDDTCTRVESLWDAVTVLDNQLGKHVISPLLTDAHSIATACVKQELQKLSDDAGIPLKFATIARGDEAAAEEFVLVDEQSEARISTEE